MIEEVKWSSGYSGYASLAESYYYELYNETEPDQWNSDLTAAVGKVGLIYPSDYGFASGDLVCPDSIQGSSCINNNWLHGKDYLTISGYADWTDDYSGCVVTINDGINTERLIGSDSTGNVRPVVYLKSDIKITGNGTNDSNIFKLSM